MDRNIKILIGIIAIAFVGLVIWVVQTTPDAPIPVEKVEPPKTMEYEGNTISEEVNGVKIWDLTADKAVIDIENQQSRLTNIVGHFYQEDGSTIELTAQAGLYDQLSKNVHIEGNVVVTTSQGAKLTSDKLDWNNEEATLTASEKVKISKDDIRASGDTALSNDGFKHFILRGHAHIIKSPEFKTQNEKQ